MVSSILPRDTVIQLQARHSVRGMAQVFVQIGILVLAIAMAVLANTWMVTVIAVILIATRQHAMAILMHDAAHRSLVRSRRMNEIVSETMLAFPLLVSTELYRRHHLAHHRHLGSARDPDANDDVGLTTRPALLLRTLIDCSGLNMLRSTKTGGNFTVIAALFRVRGDPRSLSLRRRLAFVVYWSIIAIAVVSAHAVVWLLILWFIPLLTITQALIRFNAYAEHGGCSGDHPLRIARTTLAPAISRFLLSPCNINYHLEHHLLPNVPNYQLPKLHHLLCRDESFNANAHVTHGYLLGRRSFVAEICDSLEPDRKLS